MEGHGDLAERPLVARGGSASRSALILRLLRMRSIEDLTYLIIQAAIEVHSQLGPGLLESIYERSLVLELEGLGLLVRRQVRVPVAYKGQPLGQDMVIDLIIDNRVIVEVKATTENHPIHDAQLLTYLKLTGLRHGLVINFGLKRLVPGVKSLING